MHFYRLAGLSVRSEIALPGAIVTPPADAPQVTIASGAVPAALDAPSASGPTWAMTDGCFLLRVPDIARFLMTDGRAIEVELEPGATTEDAAAFLMGTAFGILLHQRRLVLFHASAVCVDGAAVLFCGPSGAGKSTLAAALDRRGHAFVTDDFCAVSVEGGRPLVFPDGRLLKLWSRSIDKLDLAENRGAPVRSRLQKFHVEPQDVARDPLPLRAVYMLRDDRIEASVSVERANVVDQALLLRHCAFRPQIVSRMSQDRLYFQACAAIAAAAGVFLLSRPMDFAVMPEVVQRLEDHWRASGAGPPG